MLGQLPVSAAGHWGAPWPCKGQSFGEKKEQVAPAPCLSLSRAVLYTGLCPVFSPLLILLPDHSSGLKTFQQCLEPPPQDFRGWTRAEMPQAALPAPGIQSP